MGVLKEDLSKYKEARSYYQKSIQSEKNPEAYNRLARLAIKEEETNQAQAYLDVGLSLADDFDMRARLLAQQGRVYFSQQKWVEAEQALTESARLSNSAESLCLLPQVLAKRNRPQYEIDGWWYKCFYSSANYQEGEKYKDELLKNALPSLFSEE